MFQINLFPFILRYYIILKKIEFCDIIWQPMNHMTHPDQILYSKLLHELDKHQLLLKSTQPELYSDTSANE